MADAETIVQSAVAPEVQQAAEKMGWIPPSRFRGDPERFVDADIYIKRGEEVLPIVKEQNKRLHNELDALKVESSKTQAALKAATDAIAQIEERHTVDTQKAVEAARRQVKAQLSAASEAGDHDGVAELTDQLTQLNVVAPVKAAEPARQEPAAFVPPPELQEWNAENPWFGTNKRKTALALAVAQELREAGETAVGRPFFEKVAAEVDKELGVQQPRGDKVEGARNGGDGAPRGSNGKGYASLPADAKQACDAEARRFAGEGKKYKTVNDWRARYAEIYFAE
jgi:hypothetical protein